MSVDIEGRTYPIAEALRNGLVRATGLKEGYDAVQISNLSGKPMHISVKQPVVLGGPEHKAFDYDVLNFVEKGANQKSIWASQRPYQEQAILKELGYYKGKITGDPTDSASASEAFMKQHGVESLKDLPDELDDIAAEAQRLRDINGGAREVGGGKQKMALVRLTPRSAGDSTVYRLQTPDGEKFYEGNRASDIVKEVNRVFGTKDVDSVYIEGKFASIEKQDAFESSLRIAEENSGTKASFRIIPRRPVLELTMFQDAIFQRGGVKLERVSEVGPATENPGMFESQATLSYKRSVGLRARQMALKARARTKEVVQSFMGKFKGFFQGPSEPSIAEAVAEARSQLKATFNLTEERLTIELINEFGQTQIVTIDVKEAGI
jgi:hypothetical protein